LKVGVASKTTLSSLSNCTPGNLKFLVRHCHCKTCFVNIYNHLVSAEFYNALAAQLLRLALLNLPVKILSYILVVDVKVFDCTVLNPTTQS
jgi:hypothetical protein